MSPCCSSSFSSTWRYSFCCLPPLSFLNWLTTLLARSQIAFITDWVAFSGTIWSPRVQTHFRMVAVSWQLGTLPSVWTRLYRTSLHMQKGIIFIVLNTKQAVSREINHYASYTSPPFNIYDCMTYRLINTSLGRELLELVGVDAAITKIHHAHRRLQSLDSSGRTGNDLGAYHLK